MMHVIKINSRVSLEQMHNYAENEATKASAVDICCFNLSVRAEELFGCFSFALAVSAATFTPVTLWNTLTCLSPETKTYFPSESNRRQDMDPATCKSE